MVTYFIWNLKLRRGSKKTPRNFNAGVSELRFTLGISIINCSMFGDPTSLLLIKILGGLALTAGELVKRRNCVLLGWSASL